MANRSLTIFLAVTLTILCYRIFPQSTNFGKETFKWLASNTPNDPGKYNASLVIINEITDFHFYSSNNEMIEKNVLYKINDTKGKEKLQSFKLPESFDIGYDANKYRQGKQSKIKIPFIDEYKVVSFTARKFSNGQWIAVPFKLKYETIRWVRNSGEFIDDQYFNFQLQNIDVGDFVEIHYKAEFVANYGSNLFYFNSEIPKVKCEYKFQYPIKKEVLNTSFLLPIYVKDSVIREQKSIDNKIIITDKILIENLEAINYPANGFQGSSLPHVFVDFTFYRHIMNSYPDGSNRVYDYVLIRPKNFEWLVFTDTNNYYTKTYDKNSASIRKFIASLPPLEIDSSNNTFFSALCDTINAFRYISSNQLFYNEQNLTNVSSGDHLLKRRVTGQTVKNVYSSVLNESKKFYYLVNIQDRRFSEHSMYYRAHYAYESELIAVPSKNSYLYFMPRTNGVKYHLNELPFYFEGVLGALQPKNFQPEIRNKETYFFKFIKTHKGTSSDNTRTENAVIKINTDSLKAEVNIKESISGQFSTILRHLYLNEYLDSTISPHYFKKCVDKPGASAAKIKFTSKITEFPFRYSFVCSERLNITSISNFDITDWFSFPISSKVIPEKPNHDYYIDFEFSDSYNFLLDFDHDMNVSNISDFTRNVKNELFDLHSEIVKNAESKYLIKVNLVVKNRKVALSKMDLLMDLVKNLDEINSFVLFIEKKQ